MEKIQSQPTALGRLPSNWLGSGSDPKTAGGKKKKRRAEFEYSLSVRDISKAACNGNKERLSDRDSAAVSLQAFLCSYDLGQANFWQISQGHVFLSGEAVVSISKGWIHHSATEQLWGSSLEQGARASCVTRARHTGTQPDTQLYLQYTHTCTTTLGVQWNFSHPNGDQRALRYSRPRWW